ASNMLDDPARQHLLWLAVPLRAPERPRRAALLPYPTLFRSADAGPDAWRRPALSRLGNAGDRLDRRRPAATAQAGAAAGGAGGRSEEHTSELQSRENPVCRLRLEKKKGLWAASEKQAPTEPA